MSQVDRELDHDDTRERASDLRGAVRPTVDDHEGGVGVPVDRRGHLLEHATDVALFLVGADGGDDLFGAKTRALGLEALERLGDGVLAQIVDPGLLEIDVRHGFLLTGAHEGDGWCDSPGHQGPRSPKVVRNPSKVGPTTLVAGP